VQNHTNLTWSIEGGRTRTGKLRPPVFGILRYLTDAVDEIDGPEVYLVPTSIVYDQLHEVEAMTTEAYGATKRPEDLRFLVRLSRQQGERLGRAYLDFARTEAAYYAAMFETRLAAEAHPGLQAAGDRAFGVLRAATERLIAALPEGRRPPALMVALHVWSMAHGVASLFCRPDRARRKLPMAPEELLEAGLLVYLQSLGLAGGARG